MTVWLVAVLFVAVVAILTTLGSRRTRGRSCCAPADPGADLRMRAAQEVDSRSDVHR